MVWTTPWKFEYNSIMHEYFSGHNFYFKITYLFLRCWGLPRHLNWPLTMMATRLHRDSHSSILKRKCVRGLVYSRYVWEATTVDKTTWENSPLILLQYVRFRNITKVPSLPPTSHYSKMNLAIRHCWGKRSKSANNFEQGGGLDRLLFCSIKFLNLYLKDCRFLWVSWLTYERLRSPFVLLWRCQW